MKRLLEELREAEVGKVLENEPLANHTTIKIGGPVDIFIEPNDVESIRKALNIINCYGVNWRAIGRGSNLLVSDAGIEGAVIKLGEGLSQMDIVGNQLTVGGGYSVVRLATTIGRRGFSGLEFASGIPGSIGGAVYMNAGAHGSEISKILVEAQILFDNGQLEWLSNEKMEFSYRTSILQNKRPGICVAAVLQLSHTKKEEIIAAMKENKEYRRRTQPWSSPCAGSIFRNPLPYYAGQLIEEANLKGYQIGGAKISEMHGNFIVNNGGAKAQDVLDLIEYVKETIYQMKKVKMETEVEIIGRN